MLLLGIDLGTSSIKVSVIDAHTQDCLASVQYPETEAAIISPQPGWAEQSPDTWWQHVQQAILKANATKKYDPKDIGAIGIAYQMHGLVCVDEAQQVLRNSIIWCDSRSVEIGEKAFKKIGKQQCLSHLLNSPGNFTASKLAWVKENEPQVYEKIHHIMLPGDFIAMKFTGTTTTSIAALSEGIFWDFKKDRLSKDVFKYFGFDKNIIPSIHPVFTPHGELKRNIADALSLKIGIPVTYKAGDQPNNALSLNVLEPGEVAATAGTSGVIYAVSDQVVYDKQSRVNTFAHVNHKTSSLYDDEVGGENRLGVLLCINGTGIMNRWVRDIFSPGTSYNEMNSAAQQIKPGSDGLRILPFGNGAERMLNNKMIGAQIHNLDLNTYTPAHFYRAVQEGTAFAFRYGLDIMKENGIEPSVIRAGKANMFLSDLFTEAFVNATQVPVEIYESDGSIGAAIGAGIGANFYTSAKEAYRNIKKLKTVEPGSAGEYKDVYRDWKKYLENLL
ncbi:MAG: carbohydrate kinase [Chitinophagaceae bacterium]|nr:MAG: carbohydrate kinase [Chitinophagaceae bacterium]